MKKLIAQAGLEETKDFLDWLLDCRRLTVRLPHNKAQAWGGALSKLIKGKDSTHSVLDTNVGRLTHLAAIIRPVLHFLSRLRQLRDQAEGRRGIKVTEAVKDDLQLFLRVINLAKTGISMNLLTFRLPTHVYRSDACPAGLGGYNDKGRA